MKRLLLDTHALLWWLDDARQLGPRARRVIGDTRNEVYVSAVSGWEIAIKRERGKLDAPEDLGSLIEDEGFSPLPVTFFHGEQAGALPRHHADPFDRMLIAQARTEGLAIVTEDARMPQYGVAIVRAGE